MDNRPGQRPLAAQGGVQLFHRRQNQFGDDFLVLVTAAPLMSRNRGIPAFGLGFSRSSAGLSALLGRRLDLNFPGLLLWRCSGGNWAALRPGLGGTWLWTTHRRRRLLTAWPANLSACLRRRRTTNWPRCGLTLRCGLGRSLRRPARGGSVDWLLRRRLLLSCLGLFALPRIRRPLCRTLRGPLRLAPRGRWLLLVRLFTLFTEQANDSIHYHNDQRNQDFLKIIRFRYHQTANMLHFIPHINYTFVIASEAIPTCPMPPRFPPVRLRSGQVCNERPSHNDTSLISYSGHRPAIPAWLCRPKYSSCGNNP